MVQKFVIFENEEGKHRIVLAKGVDYHKNIEKPTDFGNRLHVTGGGRWKFENEFRTLRLYDLSGDFGKYDEEEAKEAFDNKEVYYFEECIFDISDFTDLVTDLVME